MKPSLAGGRNSDPMAGGFRLKWLGEVRKLGFPYVSKVNQLLTLVKLLTLAGKGAVFLFKKSWIVFNMQNKK